MSPTFYLDIFQQNRFDHFGAHQNTTSPPVQDVGARLQVHLEYREFHESSVKQTGKVW